MDSIGNVIFLAGEERFACPNSTFMFHGVGFDVSGHVRFELKSLRERLDSVQADERKIAAVIAGRTTLSTQDIDQLFLEAVTRDPSYAKANGFIHEIKDVSIPPGTPIQQFVFQR